MVSLAGLSGSSRIWRLSGLLCGAFGYPEIGRLDFSYFGWRLEKFHGPTGGILEDFYRASISGL